MIKNFKKKWIKFIKKLKKKIKDDPIDLMVSITSFLILLIATLTIGFTKAFLIFIIINLIYFVPIIVKKQSSKGSEKEEMKKKTKKTVKGKKKTKKAFKIILLTILCCFILGVIAAIGFFAYIVINAPDFDEELFYITEPSIIYDKDGNEIAKLGLEKRVTLEYDEIPEVLIDAIVATEDSRFFEHKGVDWARFLKASFLQLLGRSEAGGASTLTMQVSKNNISRDKTATGIKGIIRKFTDVYVSLAKIEKNYTKQQIMEFYVNTYWLGSNSYGVEQISLTYFGKSAKDLNLAEAAMIAGLFQAPGLYNPYTNPEATETRRTTVLKLMKRHGYITEEEYQTALKLTVEDLVIPKEESAIVSGEISEYQSFIDRVAEEVENKTGFNPYSTSMEIYTTLDTNIQEYVNDIMWGNSYNWENDIAQAGIAIIDIKNGSVRALGGNRVNDAIDKYNYATDLTKQIGSTAKPLYDYGPAIEYNNWSSYQILVDEPITYSDGNPINNWNGTYEGFETMRTALTRSRNIPALKTFKLNDKKQIIEFVTNLGLTPEIYSCGKGYIRKGKMCINNEDPNDIKYAKMSSTLHEAHAIGGYNGESPLTLAAAYAAFANKGVYNEPHTFTKLIYRETGNEFINDISSTEAMSEETAYIISDMLATTATYAMGANYNINGIRYSAKTGTTNYDYKKLEEYGLQWTGIVNDLWTVGYNTEYAVGVWYGYDELYTDYYSTVNTTQHTRLLQAVGKKVFTNKDYHTKPKGVIEIELETDCPEPTLPSKYTPSDFRMVELFIKGTEPTTVSKRFEKLNDVSNLKIEEQNKKIILTWDKVKEPEINNSDYLKNHYKSLFQNQGYLDSFVNSRLSYNKHNIGTLGYNIYLQSEDGNLKLLDFVSTNKYELDIKKPGEYTFVIKTAYSIFKSNMSDGKTTSIKVSISPNIDEESDIKDKEENEDNDTSNEKEFNNSTITN